MYGYIYLTTNLINNKKYIGMHKSSDGVLDEKYFGSGIVILEALKKYGKQNFLCEILDTADTKEELSRKEIEYISMYDAVNSEDFYNVDSGRGNTHYYECQDETRSKLSHIQKNHRTINNGISQLIVNLNELDEYLNQGWVLGRLPHDYSERIKKFKDTHYSMPKDKLEKWKSNIQSAVKGRRWLNNGIEDVQIKPEDVDNYLSKGYVFGRLFARGKSKSLTTIENTVDEEKSSTGSEQSRAQESSKC